MTIMSLYFVALQECQCHWTPMQRSFTELRMNASKSWNSFQNRKHHELSEKQKKEFEEKVTKGIKATFDYYYYYYYCNLQGY